MLAAVAMAAGSLAVVALGTAALLDLGPFAAPDAPGGLEVADRIGDCREARLDTGEFCDAGADIGAVRLGHAADGTLLVELALTEAPDLGPGLAWTVEFYAELIEGGVICRLTNAVEGQQPSERARSYALDPNTVPRQPLDVDVCSGRLDGAVARFNVAVGGQPDDEQFRLIGLVRIEHPDDPDRIGSEDDFLVRAALIDLRS